MRPIECENKALLVVKTYKLWPQLVAGTAEDFNSQKRRKLNNLSALHSCELPNLSLFFSKYRYRPGVAQRVGRGIALLFHDRGTRRGWVVSSTHRQRFTPGKDSVPILQEAGWAPGPVWTGGKSRPHGIRSRTIKPVVSRCTDWATRPNLTSLI